jgi:hypothetical protein
MSARTDRLAEKRTWLASGTGQELLGVAVLHIQATTGSLIALRSFCEITGAHGMLLSN